MEKMKIWFVYIRMWFVYICWLIVGVIIAIGITVIVVPARTGLAIYDLCLKLKKNVQKYYQFDI